MIRAAIVGIGAWGQNLVSSFNWFGLWLPAPPAEFAKFVARESSLIVDLARRIKK